MFNNVGGLTLTGVQGVNLAQATTVLFGDVTLISDSGVTVGSVDGAFALTMIASMAQNRFEGPIGTAIPLASVTSSADATVVFADSTGSINNPNFIVAGPKVFNGPVILENDTHISGSGGELTFASSIVTFDLDSLFISQIGSANVTFGGNVGGGSNRLRNFQLFDSAGVTAALNMAQFRTRGSQNWEADLILNSSTDQVTLDSENNGDIQLGNLGNFIRSVTPGEDALTVNTGGTIQLRATVGDNNQALDGLTLNGSAELGSTITAATQTYTGAILQTATTVLDGTTVDAQSSVNNAGFDLTFDVTGAGASQSTITGPISGNGDLTKSGSGTAQIVATFNSYSGDSLILGGTLRVIGNTNPSTSSPVIRVDAGATLETFAATLTLVSGQSLIGSGSVDGFSTQALPGATISPGLSPGALTVNGAVFSSSSNFDIELNGLMAGTEYDQLIVNGSRGTRWSDAECKRSLSRFR